MQRSGNYHTEIVFLAMQLAGVVSTATDFLYGHTSKRENCSALWQSFQVQSCVQLAQG